MKKVLLFLAVILFFPISNLIGFTGKNEPIPVVSGKSESFANVSQILQNYPYFHDGSADSLADAVRIMGKVQVDKAFTGDEIGKIVAFLKTLTGEYKESKSREILLSFV